MDQFMDQIWCHPWPPLDTPLTSLPVWYNNLPEANWLQKKQNKTKKKSFVGAPLADVRGCMIGYLLYMYYFRLLISFPSRYLQWWRQGVSICLSNIT